MELKICLKKLFRTPLKSFLFFLLLTVTGTLLSLGTILLVNARDTDKNIQKSFTSIAIPNFDIIKEDSVGNSDKINDSDSSKKKKKINVLNIHQTDYLNSKELIDKVVSINKLYYKILDQASETKIADVDLRKSYLGFSKDLSTVLIEPYSQRISLNEWNLNRNMAVFDVTYDGYRNITYDKNAKWYDPDIYEDIRVINWKINKTLACHPSYEIINALDTFTTDSEMEHRGLLEPGKRYLVAGFTKNLQMNNEDLLVQPKLVDRLDYFLEHSFSKFSLDTDFNVISDQAYDNYFKSYIELDPNIDIDLFLNSSQGVKYKQLIENCKFLNQAAELIATDNINAILHFNQKQAHIVSGREITPEEYEKGEGVCIVAWRYAELNNLEVGDEIKLSIASANYEYYPNIDIKKDSIWLLNNNPYSDINFKEQSFKIIGIYQAPKWEVSEFMLSPNTIFIPSRAVDFDSVNQDNVISYDKRAEKLNQIPTSLYSIVIPNNRFEEFKDEMRQKGIDKYFLYYDQGYSSVKAVIKIITQNAVIILSVCFVVWLLVLVLFILLYVVKEKKIAGIMLSLGVGYKRAFAHLLISCILLALPSAILGGVISNVLEDNVTKLSYDMAVNQVMENSFDRTFSANADSSYNILNEKNISDMEGQNSVVSFKFNGLVFMMQVLQFVIIICLSSVFIYIMLRKNPMELVKGRE